MTAGRILIVQPDPNSAYRLQKALEYDGYPVLVANTGQEAWELCTQQLPQVLVLETELPDMNSLQLLQQIRQSSRTRKIHIIALIRRQERGDQIAGLEMGADDSILKPYDVEEVRLRIRNALQRAGTGILVNPTTGLPGGRFIEDQLRKLLQRSDDWALLRVVIRHLDKVVDTYGFQAGEDLLRVTAQIVGDALDEYGGTSDFVGHSGIDAFVIITSTQAGVRLKPILVQQLGAIGRARFDQDDAERRTISVDDRTASESHAPLVSADVQMVTAADGPFQDIMQLTSALG